MSMMAWKCLSSALERLYSSRSVVISSRWLIMLNQLAKWESFRLR